MERPSRTIRVRVSIAETRPHKRPEQGMVVERLEVANQRDEVVLVCDHLLLVERREPAAGDA